MEIRTFFWQKPIIPKSRFWLKRVFGSLNNTQFRYGNAGDIYAKELLERQYHLNVVNAPNEGRRILTVGSIGHRAVAGDILCGIGVKSKTLLPHNRDEIAIYGLRGPLSYEAFKSAGFDMSNVKFLYDPGLLVKYFLPDTETKRTDVSFIPHYRERLTFRNKLPKGIRIIDIDNYPQVVASAIKASKLVYSSSLHGIIFAHALGVPCIYVKPQTDESEFKFVDYYESVNLTYKKPLSSIFEADFIRDSDTPADVNVEFSDFYFPSIEELKERGIVT